MPTSVYPKPPPVAPKIAYLVSRFPKISETFVLFELLALRKQGASVDLFAVKQERQSISHREAQTLLPEVGFCHPLHPGTWIDACKQLLSTPVRALKVIGQIAYLNRTSARYLVTSLAGLPSAFALAHRLQSNGYTHIHAHFANVPTAIAYVVNYLTGLPYSFTTHGSDLHRDQTMLAEKIVASKAAVTVSNFNLQIMQKLVPPEHLDKLRVVHCGADPSVFKPIGDASGAKCRSERAIEIGCLGSLLPVKGQVVLLDALSVLLKESKLSVNCHLIGDGPSREGLQQQADELGLDVHFTGSLTRDQVAELLPTLDIVVAPSVPTSDGRKEGIPVSLMEAMACGCAVIASNLTGIPELIKDGETGLLVTPGDARELADAIRRLATDHDLRERFSNKALLQVQNNFNLNSNAREILTLINQQDDPTYEHAVSC